ncbi:MAG: replication-associated recombination protein A [Bdellovibrio sp.]|nr:MAG: replication-associated recombination protein A [Bdellovibrio sp.]
MELFENQTLDGPLAEQLRPQSLKDFFGQDQVLQSHPLLKKALKEKIQIPNMILWGPPGTGKTTFAHLVAQEIKGDFISVNAVDTGAKKLREIGQQSREKKLQWGQTTILFIDEIHRLNRSQQDVLLPFSERGDFSLIGATTENPSYELSSALLSRCQVLIFEPLSEEALCHILKRALQISGIGDEKDLFEPEGLTLLFSRSRGDARAFINDLEIIFSAYKNKEVHLKWPLGVSDLKELLKSSFRPIIYDKNGEEHFNCISAFIKSVRGSDPDAAVYYLARMLHGGEDPVFIARRLVILASEDIGNADPRALTLAVSALQAVELVGMPEARICLSQVTTYLAAAPKSNRSYKAINEALSVVKSLGALPVPKSLCSSRTQLAQELGYGEGYQYSHNGVRGFIPQDFLPEKIRDKKFYHPSDYGFERNIKEHLAWLRGEKKKPENK